MGVHRTETGSFRLVGQDDGQDDGQVVVQELAKGGQWNNTCEYFIMSSNEYQHKIFSYSHG